MDFSSLIGVNGYQEKVVEPDDSAAKYGSGLVDVFATPAMLAFIEKTCMLSVIELLPKGFGTVGTRVNITHENATPIGDKVICVSKLIEVEGRKLVFEVIASDVNGIIGRGLHERFVIEMSKFMAKFKKHVT